METLHTFHTLCTKREGCPYNLRSSKKLRCGIPSCEIVESVGSNFSNSTNTRQRKQQSMDYNGSINHGSFHFDLRTKPSTLEEEAISSGTGMSIDSSGTDETLMMGNFFYNVLLVSYDEPSDDEGSTRDRGRGPTAADVRAARMRSYAKFQELKERKEQEAIEYKACIAEVEAMNVQPEIKVLAEKAFKDVYTRMMFMSFSNEDKLWWLLSLR